MRLHRPHGRIVQAIRNRILEVIINQRAGDPLDAELSDLHIERQLISAEHRQVSEELGAQRIPAAARANHRLACAHALIELEFTSFAVS